jgi:hypothetical protein
MTQYLNDAWREVFQEVVNSGRKDFVKEVHIVGVGVGNFTEYQLPDDFYQMVSLKNPQSGDIVLRATESSTATSGTFEVVNGKLRLYGGNQGNLLLTYYLKPLWLTYPEKDLPIELPSFDVLDTCKNSVLCKVEDALVIKNIITNEVIGSMETYPVAGLFQPRYYLGAGHVVTYYQTYDEQEYHSYINYRNYNGDILWEGEVSDVGIFGKDFNGYVYYTIFDGEKHNLYLMNTHQSNVLPETFTSFAITRDKMIVANDTDLYIYDRDAEPSNPTSTGYHITMLTPVEKQIDNADIVYVVTDDKIYQLSIKPGKYLLEDEDVFCLRGYGIVEKGLVATNGTNTYIIDLTPDILMNFPNDLYTTLVSANLAMRVTLKQNAVNEGLNTLYDNTLSLFHNSFNEENSYYRIKNVY